MSGGFRKRDLALIAVLHAINALVVKPAKAVKGVFKTKPEKSDDA